MSPNLQELKDAAAGLPSGERAELVHFLLHSLDDQGEEAVRADWLTLAEQRMTEVRAGKVIGIPAAEVLKNLLGPTR